MLRLNRRLQTESTAPGPTRRRKSSRNQACTVQKVRYKTTKHQHEDIRLVRVCTGHSFFRSNHSTMHRLWNLRQTLQPHSNFPTSYSSMQMVHSCNPPSCPTQSFSVTLIQPDERERSQHAGLPLCGDMRPCRPWLSIPVADMCLSTSLRPVVT